MQIEKRKYTRYQTTDKVYAALGEHFSRVGKVKDISLGGLAFEYIDEQDSRNDLTRIDIFVTSSGLHLSRISCKKIYDIPAQDTSHQIETCDGASIKRCGVEFDGLDDQQINELKKLIDAYACRIVF